MMVNSQLTSLTAVIRDIKGGFFLEINLESISRKDKILVFSKPLTRKAATKKKIVTSATHYMM